MGISLKGFSLVLHGEVSTVLFFFFFMVILGVSDNSFFSSFDS